MRYLVTAYYSEWVEATSEDEATDALAKRIAGLSADDYTYEIHEAEHE